jgi:hypothetical protein
VRDKTNSRWAHVAGPPALCALVLSAAATFGVCGMASGPAGAATRPLDGGKDTVASVVKHPCELLTQKQAEAAAGAKLGPEQQLPKTGLCEYSGVGNSAKDRNATVNLYVTIGTVKIALPPKDLGNTYVPVPSLGHDATWVVESHSPKGSGELFFTLGLDGSLNYNVQVEVARGGLKEATAITKDCLGHL